MIDLEDFVYHIRERTAQDFDKENDKLLSDTVSEIMSSHVASLFGMFKGADFITEGKIYLLALFRKAEDLLISSLHLARQRATIEALSLLRIALEAVATAVNISKDEKAFNDYLTRNYQSTQSIKYARRSEEKIAKIYDSLMKALDALKANTPFES